VKRVQQSQRRSMWIGIDIAVDGDIDTRMRCARVLEVLPALPVRQIAQLACQRAAVVVVARTRTDSRDCFGQRPNMQSHSRSSPSFVIVVNKHT
jgi:hypothetical protein